MAAVVFIIYLGVEQGIEKYSKVLMPVFFLMIIGVSLYSLTLSYTDASGVTRTGWEGFLVYTVPNLEGKGFWYIRFPTWKALPSANF